MSRSRVSTWLVALACVLAACGKKKAEEDRDARRTAAATIPASAPSGPALTFTSGPVACDGGQIYVASSASNTIAIHGRTATGDVPPLGVIAGDATGLTTAGDAYAPRALAADPAHGELFAALAGTILVYPLGASGNVAPLRRIFGPTTGMYAPQKLALDPVHDELWVSESSRLAAFARGASGDAAPLRTIDRLGTWPWSFSAVAVDPANDELVATTGTMIKVFSRTASGPAAPIREIGGPATRLHHPVAVAVDPVRDEIVVVDEVSYATSSAVLSFPRLAEGDVAPARAITGSSTTMLNPHGLAVDTARDEVIVANSAGYPSYPSYSGNSVTVFPRGSAETWPSPVRLLRGGATALAWPWDVALVPTTAHCAVGYACALGGCMPTGSTDCSNGTYCPPSALCGSLYDDPPGCDGPAYCSGSSSGSLIWCHAPALCDFGTWCPSGSRCASGGCMPTGTIDCGAGVHCPAQTFCTADRTGCLPLNGTDCLNGRYCADGLLCNLGGLWCVPPGVVLCGDGWYCPPGKTCNASATGYTCDPPSPGGGGGGAFCYSTSACVYGAGGTCNCSGAASQTQCVSGHPACVGVGSACGDGVHACCGGETCINGVCESGCGRCAGKGCAP